MATSTLHDAAWTTVFNRPAFHALNLRPGAESLVAAHVHDERTVGSLAGVLADGTFTSGDRAPFGGVDFARPRETPANVAATLDATLAQIEAAGAQTVRIRCRPAPYGDTGSLVAFDLLNRGFRVEVADLAHLIDLAATPTSEAYLAALKSPARRALNHLRTLDTGFAEVTDEPGWRDGHALLSENRAAKDRRLSLDADYLLRARAALPGTVRMFALTHAGASIAVAVVYVVAPGCWYVYAWGDARHELPRSPMNLLGLRTVEAALADGVQLIDLGTSTVPTGAGGALAADAGMTQFKTSLLARPHPRLVLTR
ncbi:MAG TPA: GNAT family N-acetyltransferase [Baekduia sp.]